MRDLAAMIRVEALKAVRSRMPLFTGLGFLLMPLVDAFFMIILKDPEMARQAGLISAKARLIAGTANWPTFLDVLAQAVAVGGLFLYSLIAAWVFGREFADGTAKDLLAVPVPRGTILLAKFAVVVLWGLALTALVAATALLLGALLQLPEGNPAVIAEGLVTVLIAALLVAAVMTPVALFAGLGRGYLLPLGMTILFVLFANVLAVAGWGEYFPWSVPALYTQAGGPPSAALAAVSYWIAALTGVAGMAATYLWWRFADHNR
jgi:ABC-2 type transport system permease protein